MSINVAPKTLLASLRSRPQLLLLRKVEKVHFSQDDEEVVRQVHNIALDMLQRCPRPHFHLILTHSKGI